MPPELLEFIKAVTAYREVNKTIHDNISVRDFINAMDELTKEQDAAPAEKQYEQQPGSYKVTSKDGTVTAVEIISTDLAQVQPDEIRLIWPHTGIMFTTNPEKAREDSFSLISQDEFDKLAAFVLQ